MALIKFKDYYPEHRDGFAEGEAVDFDSYHVYTQGGDQIGSVKDVLVDEQSGRFRYLVVDTGFWIFGKKVLLPIGLAQFNHNDHRVTVNGLTKEQVEQLPEYNSDMKVDAQYEDSVRDRYRPIATPGQTTAQQATTTQDYPTSGTAGTYSQAGFEQTGAHSTVDPTLMGTNTGGNYNPDYNRQSVTQDPGAYPVDASSTSTAYNQGDYNTALNQGAYDYDRDPGLYAPNEGTSQRLRLYEERLLANKNRYKTGEISVGKRVETRTDQVSVPVERERVVIERNPASMGTPVVDQTPDFHEGEVARMDVYEDDVSIEKQAFVREEVNIRKEVERDVVSRDEEVRRERLDVHTEGNPQIRRSDDLV